MSVVDDCKSAGGVLVNGVCKIPGNVKKANPLAVVLIFFMFLIIGLGLVYLVQPQTVNTLFFSLFGGLSGKPAHTVDIIFNTGNILDGSVTPTVNIDIPSSQLPITNLGNNVFGLLTKTVYWECQVYNPDGTIALSSSVCSGSQTYGTLTQAVFSSTQTFYGGSGTYAVELKWAYSPFSWNQNIQNDIKQTFKVS
jgi:hypothetical protein